MSYLLSNDHYDSDAAGLYIYPYSIIAEADLFLLKLIVHTEQYDLTWLFQYSVLRIPISYQIMHSYY